MENKIYVYRNVFNRDNVKEFSFDDFVTNPKSIFEAFEIHDPENLCYHIRCISNKKERNELKRNTLPAADISPSSTLSIDIDGIRNDELLKARVISKLKTHEATHCIMESISGNIVAFFKYDCTVEEFPYLYYKLYLELVLLLEVNIDFLPEIGRLRYVNIGEVFYYNELSEIIYETLVVDSLPYISTNTNKQTARGVIYKSV